MNLNYIGSLSQRKIRFRSTIDVIVREKNELFNAISIYIPSSLAGANIIDFDPAWVTAKKPAVMTCDVNNYKTIMRGSLLNQWEPAFRQDTNIDLVLFLIVFLDDASTGQLWQIDDASISFKPLSDAFSRLYFISYLKTMFDEKWNGEPSVIPDPGTRATAELVFSNTSGASVVIPLGVYTLEGWIIPIENDLTVPDGGTRNLVIRSASVGSGTTLAAGPVVIPNMPTDITVSVASVTPGTDPGTNPTVVPSKYFDLSLALAFLCRGDQQLSLFVSFIRITLPLNDPDTNRCWIRSKNSIAEQTENMRSIKNDDREKYYWGALYRMRCTNTWVLVHSEPVNIFAEIIAAWMASRNGSGQYVGNKLSLLRLSGTNIQPFGTPSWLNSAVNENDAAAFDGFDEMSVGYLSSIADDTVQDCCLSSARCVPNGVGKPGFPVNAYMIAKYVDYTSSQDVAKLITDKGTLVDPTLTDDLAYRMIQELFKANISLFTATRRIANITMKFPDFSVAKTGLTELTAASAWEASYVDDLDKVTVTGGVVEE